MDSWGDLVVLAERERELALAGDWDQLADASSERLRRAEALGPAPASARASLDRLVELQSQIDASLLSARAFTGRELSELRRKRTAVGGYGAGLEPAGARFDSLR
jgi:Flagellar protein FliT